MGKIYMENIYNPFTEYDKKAWKTDYVQTWYNIFVNMSILSRPIYKLYEMPTTIL